MAFLLDHNGLVTALKKMSHASVTSIVPLGIDAVQLPHPPGEVAVGSLNDQMVVISHKTVGVAQPVETLHHLAQGVEKEPSVLVVIKDIFSGVAPGGHVVDRTIELDSQRTCHGPKQLPYRIARYKT